MAPTKDLLSFIVRDSLLLVVVVALSITKLLGDHMLLRLGDCIVYFLVGTTSLVGFAWFLLLDRRTDVQLSPVLS